MIELRYRSRGGLQAVSGALPAPTDCRRKAIVYGNTQIRHTRYSSMRPRVAYMNAPPRKAFRMEEPFSVGVGDTTIHGAAGDWLIVENRRVRVLTDAQYQKLYESLTPERAEVLRRAQHHIRQVRGSRPA